MMMKGAWCFLGFVLVSLVVILSASAESNRPECPSDHPGVCFFVESGFTRGVLLDADGDYLVVFGQTGEGDSWVRVMPDGTEVLHGRGVREMNLCPAGTVSRRQCERYNPPNAVFSGTGRVNSLATEGGGDCPSSVHIRGTGTNGVGESMEFTGHYVNVRDSNSGRCRIVTLEVDWTPVP
jgi:hypothetical protein